MSEEAANVEAAPVESQEAPAGASASILAESHPAPEVKIPEWAASWENKELAEWVAKKGADDPSKLAESYRNLEKLYGHNKAGRTVIKPGEKATPEEMREYRAKIAEPFGGIPDKPEGYELPVPDGDDGEFAKFISAKAHEAGIPKADLAAMAEAHGEYVQQVMAKTQEAHNAERAEWVKEYGGIDSESYKASSLLVDRGAVFLGLDDQAAAGLANHIGPKAALEMFRRVGEALGQDKMPTGAGSAGYEAPAAKLERLRNDPTFRGKLTAGDGEAKREWDATLLQVAAERDKQ